MTTNQFEHVARSWIAKALYTNPVDVPDVLYHYTDASGLVGMLQSGVVWATDLRFLNDRQEQRHFCGASRSYVETVLSNDSASEAAKKLCIEILKYHLISSNDHRFVFSLSADSDDLSQWRGYGRDGRGYTVGLNGPLIFKTAEPDDAQFGFAKVEYLHERQSGVISKIFDDILIELMKKTSNGIDENLIEDAARWYDYAIENCSALNKHKSFVREGEWRVISVISEDEKDHIKVRSSGDRLVPYLDLYLAGEAEKLPVMSIGIGPGFAESDERHAVEALCRQHGYAPEIYFADTPYRRT